MKEDKLEELYNTVFYGADSNTKFTKEVKSEPNIYDLVEINSRLERVTLNINSTIRHLYDILGYKYPDEEKVEDVNRKNNISLTNSINILNDKVTAIDYNNHLLNELFEKVSGGKISDRDVDSCCGKKNDCYNCSC